MTVPQFAPFIDREEFLAMEDCFTGNWITEGPKAEEFIARLKALLDVKYAVLAPNGTLAIYLALRALGIERGDEVIVPDFTFIAAANAVEMAGAIPIFVDVREGTLQIDISKCARLLTPKTVAIMPVPVFGSTPDYDEIMAFAKQHGLLVIEDACESLGVKFNGQSAGTFGDAGCYSFFADKTLTTGEGGLVVTNREDIHQKLLFLRNQGRLNRGSYVHPEIGYNFRMTDFQCAIGLVQLAKFDRIVERKVEIAEHYRGRFANTAEVRLTGVEPRSTYIPFRVTILAERARELMEFLGGRGVQTRSFFYPLHKQPCFESLKRYPHPTLDFDDSQFPIAIHAYEHGVCLPTFATLTPEQIEYVCDQIEAFYARRSG
jgi:perosamine synthetase